MGSALLNMTAELEFAGTANDVASPCGPAGRESLRRELATASTTADELRGQVAERLAEHRRRRGGAKAETAEPERRAVGVRSARIAAAVAERYARTPSYREVLAAEAERTIQQARAAAEVAAQNAQAIAAAQQRLLDAYDAQARREQAEQSAPLAARGECVAVDDGIAAGGFAESRAKFAARTAPEQELWPELAEVEQSRGQAEQARSAKAMRLGKAGRVNDAADARATADCAAGLTVRLHEDAAYPNLLSARAGASAARDIVRGVRGFDGDIYAAEAMALDDEIAFRQAPVFEEPAGPPEALPANLIEFPRQLVAARKARPRYAEGPLRDEVEAAAGDGQLRIFEVDPALISTEPSPISTDPAEAKAAQWTSLWLDAPAHAADGTQEEAVDEPLARATPALQPASLGRRCAAGAINLGIVGCALIAFAAVFLTVAGHGLAGHAEGASARLAVGAVLAQTGLQARSLATMGAVSGAFLLLLYHGLFFWFSTATPGMRCVRIALCTFEDENPTRRGIRRRMAATMFSSCWLGMGYAWAALDEQRLTWHDRMSRMYLRRY
jgi:hypothetical protein